MILMDNFAGNFQGNKVMCGTLFLNILYSLVLMLPHNQQ